MNWDKIRENYPAASSQVYLNTASCGLISKQTAQAQHIHYQQFLEKGGVNYMDWMAMVKETRAKAANLLNVPVQDLLFVHNYTAGMNQIAAMWQHKFKTVLLLKGDYPSVTLPWEVHNYHCHYFEADAHDVISLQTIEAHLKKVKPSILAISHVQFSTGFKIDLKGVSALCRQYGTYLLVDATQSFGAYPIDIPQQGIDVFITSVYKWTTAGFGLGICYINPILFEACHPYWAGNNPIGQPIINQDTSITASKQAAFETGHTNFPAMSALNTALSDLTQIGIEVIAIRIDELVEKLLDYLSQLMDDLPIMNFPKENRSGIFSLGLKEEVVHQLFKENIITSFRSKGLRVSTHFYNNHDDLLQFCHVLKTIL